MRDGASTISGGMDDRLLLLGHRGSRTRGCRENTIAAFETALRHGCDGFEFDVRLTRDERAVVCHDARSRGRPLTRTDAARLAHLPLLENVLAHFGNRSFLDIELKVGGLEDIVLSLLKKSPPQRGYAVSSFLPDVLIAFRERSATIPLGFILDKKTTHWDYLPINYVISRKSLVTPKLIDTVHDEGKRLITWTVNDRRSMRRFAEWGVDGIISDKTDLLVRTLRPQERTFVG